MMYLSSARRQFLPVLIMFVLPCMLAPALLAAPKAAAPPFMDSSKSVRKEFLPGLAFDGDTKTRWASRGGDAEAWLQVDLGRSVAIHGLCIAWEAAYAVDYEVQVSRNGVAWTTIHHQTAGGGGEETLTGLKGKGRYLRILCHRPGPHPLYSIWEVSFPDRQASKALDAMRENLGKLRRQAQEEKLKRLRQALNEAGVREVVYATRPPYPDGHWYANISYFAADASRKAYAKGGGLYKLNLDSGKPTSLIEDPEGTVRDPAVHYDGHTILFSWRKGGTESFHLYTIDADGSGLTQLTGGGYDDIEPSWLPDGGIAFVSSRCRRWVNCWLTQVAVAHRCDADGGNIVPLSGNLEQDNTPWPMPDGRILYTRWEYVDRSQVDYHHLWTMNPDGAGQMTFFGNQYPGGLFIDAKPVPGAEEVLFINSPGHGAREHAGFVALVNVKNGPDNPASIRNISDNGYRDPYPVSANVFLAARGRDLMLLDASGSQEKVFGLPDTAEKLELHEPRPLIPHPREHIIPSRTDYTRGTGTLVLSDVRAGRNMAGVAPGEIKKLLVVESLPKPINYTGGMDPLTYGGSFSLERVLGAVPVEDDGSARLEVPAGRSLFFVALDEKNNSVKRMQSFLSVMPGETMSCVGCHEQRTASVRNPARMQLKALDRPASVIEPIADIPGVFDFPRDIQPILDKHCLPCHDYTTHLGASPGPRAGGVILSGDHGPMFSHSYATLTARHQFVDGRDQPKSNLPPRTIGASASPIMQKITGGHHDVALSPKEIDWIRYWIETGATYPGTYAALGAGSIGGYYENQVIENDAEWPAAKAAAEVMANRCNGCHKGMNSIPQNMSDENGLSFWRPDDWNDPRLLRSRHLLFNLTRPELSMVLLAPLAKTAGGYGLCRVQDAAGVAAPVFTNGNDPDYKKILGLCVAGKERLGTIKRFDMPGYCPPAPYYREMIRYNVLPPDTLPTSPIDFYAADHTYWQSFEQDKALQHPAYATR